MDDVAFLPTGSTRISSAPPPHAAVRRISSADANARFKSVVLPHLDAAYGLARWLTGSRTDSEDVVQDACLRALRGISTFSGDNSRAWLLTIVRNTTYSWLHKNRPAAVVEVEDLEAVNCEQLSRSDVETPETELSARDDATLLESAMAMLPIALRETLLLRELQELSYCEIAAVTEVSIGTVMSRIARARARIVAITRPARLRPNS